MHVRFELPTLGDISCRAIVRRAIEGTGVGVEFLDIDGVEHRRIVAFVTKHQVDLAKQAASAMAAGLTNVHAFELLLPSLKQAGRLVETPVRSGGKPRAARYGAQLPVRYKWSDSTHWFNGMTANISSTGLLFALDTADPRKAHGLPAPPDDPLKLALELSTPPVSQLPAPISCAARYVRTAVAPGGLSPSAIGVVVDTWHLGQAPPTSPPLTMSAS